MNNNKILILSRLFAPNNNIGARRWSKFTKYFLRKNIDVHVLTSALCNTENESYWFQDYKNNNVKIEYFKSKTDKYQKLPLYIRKIFLKFFEYQKNNSKINYFKSDLFLIFKQTKQILLRENIKHLIITGPPCELFYIGVLIKSEIPEIILTIDYRDPWNNVRDEFLLNDKKTLKKINNLLYEQLVLNIANNIVVVTETMKNELFLLHNIRTSVHVISNGFDKDDFENSDTPPFLFKKKTKYNITYTGTLGKSKNGRLKFLITLSRIIDNLNDNWFHENISFDIFSEIDSTGIKENSHFFKNNIIFHPMINNTKVLSVLQKSDMCLSINHELDKYAFGTKIFDYIYLNKPIIHISNGGELFDILQQNQHFVSDYEIANMHKLLFKIKLYLENKTTIDFKNKFQNFDLNFLSEKYLQLLFDKFES